MFLPIGDTPKPPITPYVTYLLIGINVAVFLLISLPAMFVAPDLGDPVLVDYLRSLGVRGAVPAQLVAEQISAYDLQVFRHGFRPGAPSLAALLTAMFLHGGWLHLGGNMLFLWIYGDNVEYRLGRLGYLSAYLVSGIAATLFFALFVPTSQVPLIGASGAISGVLGCYFLWFPRNRIKTFFFLFPFVMTTFLIPARWVLGFYLLVDNLVPFVFDRSGGGGVAHGAHIGGFLAGLAIAALLERLPDYRQRRRAAPADPGNFTFEPLDDATVPLAQRLQRLLARGLAEEAAQLFVAQGGGSHYRALTSPDLLALADALLARGNDEPALFLYRRLIAERPDDPRVDRACLGAGIALLRRPRGATSAYHYFLAALDATVDVALAATARDYLRRIEGGGR